MARRLYPVRDARQALASLQLALQGLSSSLQQSDYEAFDEQLAEALPGMLSHLQVLEGYLTGHHTDVHSLEHIEQALAEHLSDGVAMLYLGNGAARLGCLVASSTEAVWLSGGSCTEARGRWTEMGLDLPIC